MPLECQSIPSSNSMRFCTSISLAMALFLCFAFLLHQFLLCLLLVWKEGYSGTLPSLWQIAIRATWVPLVSIHLWSCCFVKRKNLKTHVARSGPPVAGAILGKGQQFAIHLPGTEMLASHNWLTAWYNIESQFPLMFSTTKLEKHPSREKNCKKNTCLQKCLEFLCESHQASQKKPGFCDYG